MTYNFSAIANIVNNQEGFNKWVDEKKAEIEKLIFDNRENIYKYDVRQQMANFDTLKKAWNGMTDLRKKSTDFDLEIVIDNQGYTDFRIKFPLSREKALEVLERRDTYCKENDIPRCCAYMGEWYWRCLKEDIKRAFYFVDFSEGDYWVESTYGTDVRKISVAKFKS